ncbi:DoxX family membrane protein [Pedobacter aquatilis]|uniref:MauE/DoxX family redox-associated membrane protein n=1 Tax=Pedobacter aquatilis TaxID=351343 RepID=UPI0025B310CD|nr:MauE/DoxX family redox-associated membrane protein [Pedobacter aquatilis]MDN3588307.1 DoxX family membrane protein [Pedobacter aquatilis]
MRNNYSYAQIFLRLALGGLSFIYAVLDRIGWLDPADGNIAWGNWRAFLDYTHLLLPILDRTLSDIFGWTATIGEVIFGVLLIIGYKTKLAAFGSFALLLSFGICMALSLGLKAPFNYSVFSASAGALLLSCLTNYKWSIDNLTNK